MAKTDLLAIVALALYFSAPVWAEPEDGWRLHEEKDGIRIYIRPSLQDSSIKEYRAETVLNAEVATIVRVIRDLDRQPQWVYRLESARVLERPTKDVALIHSKYRMEQFFGWPKHRDVVMRSVLSRNEETGEVRFDAQVVQHALPVDNGYERISQGRASWSFCQSAGGTVQVVTQAYVDLGGVLSLLDFDSLVAEGPFHTLSGLKRQVASGMYDGLRLDEISETTNECDNFLSP